LRYPAAGAPRARKQESTMAILWRSSALRFLLAAAAVLWAQAASASFHLVSITEVYSDASGNVQYVVLQANAGGQQFLAGHQITATQGASTHSFAFPANLPGDTTGRKFLIATQAFADLGLVTPDYVVRNGFLFLTNATVNYAGVSQVSYSSLPTDGIHAIDPLGNVVKTTPTNFAGASAAIVDCMFNWAERQFPQFFAPAGSAPSQNLAPYYYRHYSCTDNYLATSSADDHIYVLGPMSGGNIQDVAPIATYLPQSGCTP
jgi:hypothetical protein